MAVFVDSEHFTDNIKSLTSDFRFHAQCGLKVPIARSGFQSNLNRFLVHFTVVVFLWRFVQIRMFYEVQFYFGAIVMTIQQLVKIPLKLNCFTLF